MTLTLALNSAISGLSTAQAGLDVISHNIANVNTEGFTRKVFEPESRVLAGMGVGVQLGDVRNSVDQNLLKDVREERSTFGRLDVKRAFLKRVQDMFGTTTSNSTISHRVNNLQNDWEALATEPEKATTHGSAVQAGITVADQLARMSKTVQGLRLDADREIERAVQEMNGLLSSISNINDQIALNAATGRQTEDLEDKRDVALNRLADMGDIQYFMNSNGAVTVFTSDGTTLVDSSPVAVSHVALSLVNASHTYAGGDFNGIFVGMRDMTSAFRSGKLKSLVETRDRILPDMQAQLDELSRNLLEEVNLVSNRGTSFPSMVSDVTGTRRFLDSSVQTLTFSGAQTNVVIYDGNGNERFSSRILDPAGINFTNGTSVDSLATQLQSWLQGLDPQLANATAAVNSDGRLQIRMGTETFGIAFRDETTAVKGSEPLDATVAIDLDGDGNNDQTHVGFSNFFGLNDYFVTDPNLSQWDSKVKPANFTLGITASRDLQFTDDSNPTGITLGFITVDPSDTLEEIRDKINQNTALQGRIEAEVIPDGAGKRLRIQHILGEQMVVTQTGGTGTDAIDALGLNFSHGGFATKLRVNQSLIEDPSLVSRGRVQFDQSTGRYLLSPGDNQIAQEMAAMLSGQVSFNAAGSLSAGNVTFAEYSASIISHSSTLASAVERDHQFQSDLTGALELKHAGVSGVNLDQEMSNLLTFQQTYAASAKVISATSQLFDILNNLID